MGIFRAILVFIKTAFRPAGTAVAGTRSAISSGALERSVFRAVQGAPSAIDTFAVIIAFKGHVTFVGKSPV